MSGQSGSIGSIVLGVVVGIFAVYTGQYYLLLTSATLIAGGAVGLAFKQKTNDPNAAKASELQITGATVGTVIPVIFGTCRVVGTFMQYKLSTFRSEEVKEKPSGSKEAVTTGHKYHLTWEQMLCMGQIDEVVAIISSPGERAMTPALQQITTTRQIATCLADFNQPSFTGYPPVGGSVTIRFSSTALMLAGDSIRIPGCGSYFIVSVTDTQRAVCKLITDELSPWWPVSLTRIARGANVSVLPYPSPAGVTRILSFVTTTNFRTGDIVKVSGFGSGEIGIIYNTHDAQFTFSSMTSVGVELASGTPIKIATTTAAKFNGSDYVDIVIGNANEGGTVRVYRGSPTQTRIAARDPYHADGYNYRQFCWALFIDFTMGFTPQPKSYNFILRRFPMVKLDDGTDLSLIGFKRRGSNTSTHPCYTDANPSALIWEAFTNQIWGAKIASRWFDAESFIDESSFFAKNNIGISVPVLQIEKVSDFLEGVRKQCRTIFVWNGDKLKLRCLLDVRRTHSVMHTVGMQEISNFEFTRPLWPSTFNTLKGEFVDRARNYRPNMVTDENQANIQIVGKVNQQTISMNGFTDFETARTQLTRILFEMSFPAASFSFTMPRFKANMEVGDVVRIVNAELAEGTVTIFGLVTKKAPKGTEYEVSCIEDPDVPSVEGTDLTTDYPNRLPYGQRDPLNPDGRDFDVADIGRIAPVLAFEFPAVATRGAVSKLAMIGKIPDPVVIGSNVYGSQDFTNFSDLGKESGFAIMGKLLTTLPAGEFMNRGATGFQFSLIDTNDDNAILAASLIEGPEDDLEQLDVQKLNYLAVGEEIIQVGTIESIGVNQYRATNYLRGVLGSRAHYHPIDEIFGFSAVEFDGVEIAQGKFVENRRTAFRAYPITGNSLVPIGDDVFPVHIDSRFQDPAVLNGKYLNLGVRPLTPELHSTSKSAGLTDTVRIVPRFFDRGAGVQGIDDNALSPVVDFGGVQFLFRFHKNDLTASDYIITYNQSSYNLETDGGADAGLLVAGITPVTPGTWTLYVAAVLGSEKSIEELVVPL